MTEFRSKQLRANATEAEKLLWQRIRNRQLGCKFRRQVEVGPYYPDFTCFELRLIIELDGGQHTQDKDKERTSVLERYGYTVIRFWNHDVLGNIDGVLETLQTAIAAQEKPP